ncbi:hypothetical protein CDV31_002978 [Fusarium ambrosium]|uniref:Heterokaryon incompatibility domain-containing protein n=1 Tax=Fusarium ambrosium TaxID=131363 RepID=A0A428UVF3_9HYPO|nr:hypothetical protein CDV31_002978 [Fusarium ambrosium]
MPEYNPPDSGPEAESRQGFDASDNDPETLNEMMDKVNAILATSLQGVFDTGGDDITVDDPDIIISHFGKGDAPQYTKLMSQSAETRKSLEAPISAHLRVLNFGLPDSNVAGVLCNLTGLYMSRYMTTSHAPDLEDALAFGRRAQRCAAVDDPLSAPLLANLSTALRLRYLCSDSLEDLEEAISLIERAISVTPADSSGLGHYYLCHVGLLFVRYQRTLSLEHLRAAMAKTRDALHKFPRDMPSVGRQLAKNLFMLIRTLAETGQHGEEILETLEDVKHRDPMIEEFLNALKRKAPIVDLGSIFKTQASEGQPLSDCTLASDDVYALELLGEEYGPSNPIELKQSSALVFISGCNRPASVELIPIHDGDTDLTEIKAFEVYDKMDERMEEDQLKDDWAYRVDNSHAVTFFQREPGELPTLPESTSLCQRCESFGTISPGSEVSFCIAEHDVHHQHCSLCKLLYTYQNDTGSIIVSRTCITLKTDAIERRILRICADPESRNPPEDVQIGFPILPQRDTQVHFELLRHWLRICDEEHKCFQEKESQHNFLPTRVIDVNSETLHISAYGERGRYVTLSHCWGAMSDGEKDTYCTYKCNISQKRKRLDLPKTFRDAVAVTRNMGVRFLWIDSVCIIQPHKNCSVKGCDSLGDWREEACQMGGYYGKSYVTIAATSAQSSKAGFLRRPTGNEEDCTDVEAARLNSRGWVLQERALSRRTIHFSSTQTYWECKKGIKCETMTSMSNPRSGLLGDPRFPESIMDYSKVNRSRLIGFLFENYSKRGLTNKTDLPLAISALLDNLSDELSTKTQYGIIQRYLHRSLLWRRDDAPLVRISYPEGKKVPSWSWMAFDGHIRYLNPPSYHNIEWNKSVQYISVKELPERPDGTQRSGYGLEAQLKAPARSFPSASHDTSRVVFDQLPRMNLQGLKYVIVGRTVSNESSPEQKYFVLVVEPVEGAGDEYERVGVGCIGESEISHETSAEVVWII